MMMVERVAKAIGKKLDRWIETGERLDHRDIARAAIEAVMEPSDDDPSDILERLKSSAAYMDEKARDRFVVTAEDLHGAIVEIERLREALSR